MKESFVEFNNLLKTSKYKQVKISYGDSCFNHAR